VIPQIAPSEFDSLVSKGIITEGMIPKLHNAFEAIEAGVKKVVITSPDSLDGGTAIVKDPVTED
jgi:acetylglutamate kinase